MVIGSGSMRYMASTCICIASTISFCNVTDFTPVPIGQPIDNIKQKKISPKAQRKQSRKALISESKAQELLRDFIGFDQWKTYRKTNRVILRPNNHFWIIGDIYGRYNKFNPFYGKPDVVRIDNEKRLQYTDFCAIQDGGEQTPYTDKVVLFALNLINDEKSFLTTINRMKESKFNRMKECAVWDTGSGFKNSFSAISGIRSIFKDLYKKIGLKN